MKLEKLAVVLNIKTPRKLSGFALYNRIRKYFYRRSHSLTGLAFQSPSVRPSTVNQRSTAQTESEHSVYQRSDYTPISLENSLNSIFPPLGTTVPFTLMFNSGMAAVSATAYFLYGHKKITKMILGENVYFETKWVMEGYHKFHWFNEYKQNLSANADVYWFEYPINCTQPENYPFQKQLDLPSMFIKLLTLDYSDNRHRYIVIDYTLSTLPLDLTPYLKNLPQNLTIILITSLQKHRGLGLDLTNAGAVTVYSHSPTDDLEHFSRIRAILGGCVTQETSWLMPPLNTSLINQIIIDSGKEARRIYHLINRPKLPVKFFCADNQSFQTSFIFVMIDSVLMQKSVKQPFYSDLLIKELVLSARRHQAHLIQGTSFGFPFSRIFKNSERYDNTNSLRIAVGYDSGFNVRLSDAIIDGVDKFIKKYQ